MNERLTDELAELVELRKLLEIVCERERARGEYLFSCSLSSIEEYRQAGMDHGAYAETCLERKCAAEEAFDEAMKGRI